MTHIWQGLRSRRWLTPARIRGYSLIQLGCASALTVLLAVYVFTMRHAMLDREVPGADAGAIAQA